MPQPFPTLGATDNLAALRARSPEIPLYETAEIVGRRPADQLREAGLDAAIVDSVHGPLTVRGHETWRAVRDDDDPSGHLARTPRGKPGPHSNSAARPTRPTLPRSAPSAPRRCRRSLRCLAPRSAVACSDPC